MSPEVNLLFTSVGRRVELLRAFRRAYKALGLAGRIIGTDVERLAPALQETDRPYLVPWTSNPEYPAVLAGICRRESITLVIPLIDPDIPVLAEHRALFEREGARAVVVSEAAARVTADKWLTRNFFHHIGLATPTSWLREEIDCSRVSFPLFIKPRNGSASKSTFKVHDARELEFFCDYVPNPIIQEFVVGAEVTSDVICDPAGMLLGVVSRQRIEVRGGEVVKGVTIHNEKILRSCEDIARELPAVGPITVQCLMDGETPLFTEINARYGGGAPLGIAAGVDSPRWLLAWAAGIDTPIPALGTYRPGLYLSRYDDSLFQTEAECEQLARHHL
jgi:carbamoyl-phosphate synthase large subunit